MESKYQKHGKTINDQIFNALADHRKVTINGHATTMSEFFGANETLTREEKVEIINLGVGETWLPNWMVQIPVTRIV